MNRLCPIITHFVLRYGSKQGRGKCHVDISVYIKLTPLLRAIPSENSKLIRGKYFAIQNGAVARLYGTSVYITSTNNMEKPVSVTENLTNKRAGALV